MATLDIPEMPDELYERVRRLADEAGRSISQEAVRFIRLGLLSDRPKRDTDFGAWLKHVTEQRERWAREGRKFPDSTMLIREDRDR